MPSFSVIWKYERNRAIRKSNLNRLSTIINRLKKQNIAYEYHKGLFIADRIPDNIKRLITIHDE